MCSLIAHATGSNENASNIAYIILLLNPTAEKYNALLVYK
jgi:hypothetical protein